MFLTGFFFAFVGAATAATEGMRSILEGEASCVWSGLLATACLHVSGCFCVFAGIYEMPATEGMRKHSRGRSAKSDKFAFVDATTAANDLQRFFSDMFQIILFEISDIIKEFQF